MKEDGITRFHITHHKAGSQWISTVLEQVTELTQLGRFLRIPRLEVMASELQIGAFYSPAYLSRQELSTWLGDYKNLSARPEIKRIPVEISEKNRAIMQSDDSNRLINFVVIRDIRDTAVSLFHSIKFSHSDEFVSIKKRRNILNDMTEEEGYNYVINEVLSLSATIQLSWINNSNNVSIFHYEDFIYDERSTFKKVIDLCELDISDHDLNKIVDSNSFKQKTGRERGQEDKSSHLRSGTSGNWKQHFSEESISLIKEKYGDLLIKTGYETSINW